MLLSSTCELNCYLSISQSVSLQDLIVSFSSCIRNGKVMFNIQSINVLRAPIKVTDFYILPDYNSNNFYKTNNK